MRAVLLWANQAANAAPTSGQASPYRLFAYNANGEPTQIERRAASGQAVTNDRYDWDGMGKLRQVFDLVASTSRYSASYDGDGGRISATFGGATHNYSYAGGLVHDSAGDVIHTPGLSQRTGGSTGTDRFFHQDWIGSTRYFSDSTGNAAPTGQRFDAFGNKSSGFGTDTSTFGFAGGVGYESDGPNGLQLLGERYYDPSLGRFLSPDPIGLAGGLNLYAYCEGDPVGGVDPSGLVVETPWDIVLVVVDLGFIGYDFATNAPPAVKTLDSTALGIDVMAMLVPAIPGGPGRAVAWAGRGAAYATKAGVNTYRAERALVTTARFSTKLNLLPEQYKPSPPNPDSKRGCPEHQQRVEQIEQCFKSRKWTHIAGGSLKEQATARAGGGRVFADLIFERGGSRIAIQVGKVTKGGKMVAREARNLRDLVNSGKFKNVYFARYNRP